MLTIDKEKKEKELDAFPLLYMKLFQMIKQDCL